MHTRKMKKRRSTTLKSTTLTQTIWPKINLRKIKCWKLYKILVKLWINIEFKYLK